MPRCSIVFLLLCLTLPGFSKGDRGQTREEQDKADVADAAGQLVLVPYADYGAGSFEVRIVNGTHDAIPRLNGEGTRVFKQTLVDGEWLIVETRMIDCGSFGPAKDLLPGEIMVERAEAPMVGDLAGKIRYILVERTKSDRRPAVSDVIFGRFSSDVAMDGDMTIFEEPRLAKMSPFNTRDEYLNGGVDQELEERRYLHGLRLLSEFRPNIRLRHKLRVWLKVGGGKWFGGRLASASFKEGVAELLEKPWTKTMDPHRFLQVSMEYLMRRERGSEELREDTWTRLSAWMNSEGREMVNPEEFDLKKRLEESGNPWGATEEEMRELLELAERDSFSGTRCKVPLHFLTGYWNKPAYYPTARAWALLKKDSRAAKLAALQILQSHGKRTEASLWAGANIEELGKQAVDAWLSLRASDEPMEAWEIPVIIYLLKTDSNSFFENFPIYYTEPLSNGKPGYRRLPNGLHIAIRSYLDRGNKDSGSTDLWDGSIHGWLERSLEMLDSWDDPGDNHIFETFLSHPAYKNSEWVVPETGLDFIQNIHYPLRAKSEEILKRRKVEIRIPVIKTKSIKRKAVSLPAARNVATKHDVLKYVSFGLVCLVFIGCTYMCRAAFLPGKHRYRPDW